MIIIVPWRGGAVTKSRLAPVLDERERIALSAAMLGGVVATVRAATAAPLWIVSPARPPVDCDRWLRDGQRGMNAAAMVALDAAGSAPVLVLPADLPRLKVGTLRRLLARMDARRLIVAPDADRIGTNALGLPRADSLVPRFGADSFVAHLDAGHAAGLRVEVFEAEDLAFDLDRPAQFARLAPDWRDNVAAA